MTKMESLKYALKNPGDTIWLLGFGTFVFCISFLIDPLGTLRGVRDLVKGEYESKGFSGSSNHKCPYCERTYLNESYVDRHTWNEHMDELAKEVQESD